MATKLAEKNITVYVRLGENEDVRTLSFDIPPNITQADLLDEGFAIDGHSAVYAVKGYYNDEHVHYPEDAPASAREAWYVPLHDALRQEQENLIGWLKKKGYTVTFR